MSYYNDDFTDFVMKKPTFLPRYSGLARKALRYYLGDRYDPHTFDFKTEFVFRQIIQTCVQLRVFEKQEYDWEVIDHFFRKVLNDVGFEDVAFDPEVLEKGYNGVMRGDLPNYHC